MNMPRFCAVILLLPLFTSFPILLPSTSLAATTFTVSTTADNTTGGDGNCTLREAIQQFNGTPANTDCGTLTGEPYTINFAVSGSVTLASNLNIYHTMTIDGTEQTVTISGNNSVRLFYIPEGVTFNAKSLTMANGHAEVASGIYNAGGTLNVDNCIITGNSATYDGGGIYNQNGTVTVTNCTITGNSAAGGFGGGIENFGGAVAVTNSTITGNSSSSGGGGIQNDYGQMTVTNCTVSNNSTLYSGGGINSLGTTTVTDSTITGNSAIGAGGSGGGGGIKSRSGTLTVTNCTISGNSATGIGGGIYCHTGSASVSDSTISGNSATYSGGGIGVNQDVTLAVNNSTISENSVTDGDGGGIINYGALTLTNCTISGNSAMYSGGGINESWGTVTISNSTISGNSGTSGGGIYKKVSPTLTVTNSIIAKGSSGANCYNVFATGSSNNLADDDTCGSGFTESASILLGPLGNYGGSTQTIPLLPGSAAIDAGDGATCADAATVNSLDQRGIARPVGLHCDIGAFESQGFTLVKSGGDSQSTFINSEFPTPLGLTVTAGNGGEPVNGGTVTFTAPSSGASTNPATFTTTIGANGAASATATANGTAGGPYGVAAGAAGAASVDFNLTNIYGEATLTIAFAGDGSGTVTNTSPADPSINCINGTTSVCSATYPYNTSVTLVAGGNWKSTFKTWSGGVASSDNPVTFSMNGNKTIAVTFDPDYKVRLLGGGLFTSVQDSYASVPTGSMTIQAQVKTFQEELLFGNASTVTLSGGMDSEYNQTEGYSRVKKVTVGKGQAVIGNFIIE